MPSHRPSIPAVDAGSAVAVVAPASAPTEWSDFEAGIRRLQAAGLTVVSSVEPKTQMGYLSASDDARAEALNNALRRSDVRAIFCARGGYGALRIIERIDYASMESAPKIIVGYSDVTAIHLAVLARTGIPGLSAAMVATDWGSIDEREASSVLNCLSGDAASGVFAPEGIALKAVRQGKAEGRLIGGNLSVLCRLIGTPYLPDVTGAILFVEDVGEPPYRIDGMLAQLRLSGVLRRIGGLVIGSFTEADPPPGKPSLPLDDVLNHYAAFVDGPVASGLPYGHFQPKEPVPVGIRGRLSVDGQSARLSALEQLVR